MDYRRDIGTERRAAYPWHIFADAGVTRTWKKDKLIYAQGDTADCIYYLLSGRVKSFIASPEGKERLLTIYQAGDIFGEAAFFDGRPRFSSAQLMTDGSVAAVDRAALERCMQTTPSLTFDLLRYLSAAVRMLSTHLDTSSFLPADKRTAHLLLRMTPDASGVIVCTNEELGSALGISRVTVSRVLNALAKRGWITLKYRAVIVNDRNALREYCGDDNGI